MRPCYTAIIKRLTFIHYMVFLSFFPTLITMRLRFCDKTATNSQIQRNLECKVFRCGWACHAPIRQFSKKYRQTAKPQWRPYGISENTHRANCSSSRASERAFGPKPGPIARDRPTIRYTRNDRTISGDSKHVWHYFKISRTLSTVFTADHYLVQQRR